MSFHWKTTNIALILTITLGVNCLSGAEPAAPKTIWQCLDVKGIKKAMDTCHAKIFNHSGKFPGLEKKAPLKMITDATGPEGGPAAIAAKIKAEEDQAAQKIKAIRYLATVGCNSCIVDTGEVDENGNPIFDYGRSKEITGALIKAMLDCTESVRLAAVEAVAQMASGSCSSHRDHKMKAIAQAIVPSGVQRAARQVKVSLAQHHSTGGGCNSCSTKCCCNPPIIAQLAKMAYERRDDGCWYEPSARVRKAAAQALQLCCPSYGAVEIVEDDQDEREDDESRRGDDVRVPVEEPDAPSVGEPKSASRNDSLMDQVTRYDTPTNQVTTPISSSDPLVDPAVPDPQSEMRFGNLNAGRHASLISGDSPKISVLVDGTSPVREIAPQDCAVEENAPLAPIDGNTTRIAIWVDDEFPVGQGDMRVEMLASAPEEDVEICGTVARIDTSSGVIQIDIDNDILVPVGSSARVYHRFLLGERLMASLQVIESEAGWVEAKCNEERSPRIARGDTVVFSPSGR